MYFIDVYILFITFQFAKVRKKVVVTKQLGRFFFGLLCISLSFSLLYFLCSCALNLCSQCVNICSCTTNLCSPTVN